VAWHDDLVGGVMNEPGNKTGNFRKCGDVLFHHIKKAYLYIATFLHLDKKDLIATHPNGYGLTLRKSSAFRTETEHDIVLVQCQKKTQGVVLL